MNRIYYLATLALLALASCTNLDDDFRPSNPKKQPSKRSEVQRYQVSLRSATYFAQKLQLEDGVSRQIKSIEPVTSGQDTLLYFVNYAKDQGWVVLSGDKRTEAILASSTVGSIEKDALGGSAVWFDDLAGKIYGIKHSNSKPPQSGDYAMWCKIDTLTLGLRPEGKEARALPPKEPGEYDYEDVLVDSKVEVVVDKAVGPLTKTKWGQSKPWNMCTPYWRNTGERCLTGCVAVAGAQMLYYLHYFKNKPQGFYSRGWCTGYVWDNKNHSYTFHFEDFRADTWDKMLLKAPRNYPLDEGTEWVALLMGFVGFHVGMEYGIEASGAYTEKLVQVYRMFDIGAEFTDYDTNLVKASLDKMLPVNIEAYAEKTKKKFLFIKVGWHYANGHSWIIDGYKEKRIRYTYTYERRPIEEHGEIQSVPKDKTVIVDAHPSPAFRPSYGMRYTVTEYHGGYFFWKMNFGWGGSHDSGDYLTHEGAVWETNVGDYQYRKKLIHNFSF